MTTEPMQIHPTELAYIFTYLKVGSVIGWGADLFLPPPAGKDAFYEEGLARLTKAERVLPGRQPGRHRFSDEFRQIAMTLSDPQIVFVTQRKAADGVRTLTHHLSGTHVVEMSLGTDGTFAVVEHASLAGAAGAAAAFAGTDARPVKAPVRIEANQHVFGRIKELAGTARADTALPGLLKLGADEASARSVLAAFGRPEASGMVSAMYCAANAVQDVETYAVLTNAAGESWVVFAPAAAEGPVVLERTSIGSLAARILVAVSARMALPE